MRSVLTVAAVISMSSVSSYNLTKSQRGILCHGEDSMSFILDGKKTVVKYIVEGESLGAQEIISRSTDKRSFASYTTQDGTLTISDIENTFLFRGETEPMVLLCKLLPR